MKRLIALCVLASSCLFASAQEVKSEYRIVQNGLSGSYEPADQKKFESGQVIVLKGSTSFEFERARGGTRTTVMVSGMNGTFEVDSLFRLAQNDLEPKGNESGRSKGASNPKGSDSTLIGFTNKIVNVMNDKQSVLFECGPVEVKRDGREVTVTNVSDNTDMFVDIVWNSEGRCMSALSFSEDHSSKHLIYPGESIVLTVNEFFTQENLYVACTPDPIEYNTIDLRQDAGKDLSRDMDIPLTIIPLGNR